nr:hypothetical protein [Tanacetum cinerariifolium]
MSSDNAQSAVTYTSISSDSDRPSWGIPLMNAGEFPKMDPYEEVAQQGTLEYNAPSDDDIQVEDDDEDLEEDPSEEHEPEDDDEDPEEYPNKGPKDSDETEPFEEDETELINAFAAGSSLFPLPPTSPSYDQAPLGHKAAMIHRRDDIPEEDTPPRRRFAFTAPPHGCDIAESYVVVAARAHRSQYDFVDTVEARQGLIHSSGHDAWTIARATDRAEDVGYEVHQAYLSSEAWNRALLVLLETLETHMSRMEWQRRRAEDLAVTQMMRIHTLEARAHTDMVEDDRSSY